MEENKRDERELKNHLPYWIGAAIEEPLKGLRSVSFKLYLSFHEYVFACEFLLVCLIYLCMLGYVFALFSSCEDDYHENPCLAMNINIENSASCPYLDLFHHQFQHSSTIHHKLHETTKNPLPNQGSVGKSQIRTETNRKARSFSSSISPNIWFVSFRTTYMLSNSKQNRN